MNSNKQLCYILLTVLSLSVSSAFTLNIHGAVPSSTSLLKKSVNNSELRAMFGGDGSSENTEKKVAAPALEIDDDNSSNFAEPQKYVNLATGEETDVQFRDAYSKANSELSLTWGYLFVLYPVILFLNDAWRGVF